MLAPFMADQAHRWHDVEQGAPQRLRHPVGFARPAEFRIALFVLRPEPMNDEAVIVVRRALLRAPGRIVFQAPARRPRERQDIEIETAAERDGWRFWVCRWRGLMIGVLAICGGGVFFCLGLLSPLQAASRRPARATMMKRKSVTRLTAPTRTAHRRHTRDQGRSGRIRCSSRCRQSRSRVRSDTRAPVSRRRW